MFTISVGNLPPAAAVLIKVTFVSELVVKDGSVLFSLPGSVAPWQESAALHQTTQVRGGWLGVGFFVFFSNATRRFLLVLRPPPGDGGEGVRDGRRGCFKVSSARRMFRRRFCCPVKLAGGGFF